MVILIFFYVESNGKIEFEIYLAVFVLDKNGPKINLFSRRKGGEGVEILQKKWNHLFCLCKKIVENDDIPKSSEIRFSKTNPNVYSSKKH